MSVKSEIQKHLKHLPRINAIQYCIRHSKNIDYCKYVMQKEQSVMRWETLGNKNPERNIYLIEYANKGDGFFAEYRKLLHYLYYANRFHMVPVISFMSDFTYAEKEPVNNTTNPFEYYFSQPSSIILSEAYESKNVFRCMYCHLDLAEGLKEGGGYSISDEYIREMGKISKKYILLNDITAYEIDKDCNGFFSDAENVLGVHYRGGDFKQGYNGHPMWVGPEVYLQTVKKTLEDHKFDSIFLATDDEDAYKLFKMEFGSKLFSFSDTTRTSGQESVAFSKGIRKNHHYKLGFEVLRDMIALSRCGGLIAGMSQVSICAQITKCGRDENYRYINLIDIGINENGKNYDGKNYG